MIKQINVRFGSALIAAVLLACTALNGQAPAVGVVYHPGDAVHIIVSFKSPVTLTNGRFLFVLNGAPHADQQGFEAQFGGTDFKRLSETEYEVSGDVSPIMASGGYRLEVLYMTMQGVTKLYNRDPDLAGNEITIRIENAKHIEFPGIKDVRVQP
jgi:hypothetical protein